TDDVTPVDRTFVKVQLIDHLADGVHRPRELSAYRTIGHEDVCRDIQVVDVDDSRDILSRTKRCFLVRLKDLVVLHGLQNTARMGFLDDNAFGEERASIGDDATVLVNTQGVGFVNYQVAGVRPHEIKRVLDQQRSCAHVLLIHIQLKCSGLITVEPMRISCLMSMLVKTVSLEIAVPRKSRSSVSSSSVVDA